MLLDRYVIWDIDNCLADDKWRAHLIDWDKTGNERYERYNSHMMDDKAHNLEAFRVISKIATPIFFTGRCEKWMRTTQAWLKAKTYTENIAPWFLYMRGDDDRATPANLKKAMLDKVAARIGLDKIIGAFDDIPAIVEMYQQHGIPAAVLCINEDFSGIYKPRDLAPVSNHA